jgi:receptor expression-enhancing protein 1/2/3/4
LFAAYKSLRKNPTPEALAPWLTFYATLSVVNFLESTVLYPLSYVPGYAWLRLFGHVYLLMPAPQGATKVYTAYVEPLLFQYESEIEDFISDAHEKLKALGLQYFKQAIDWVRVNMLNQQPRPATPPGTAGAQGYAQSLLSRFYSTSATGAAPAYTAPVGNEFYSSVFGAVQAAAGGFGAPRSTNRSVDLGSSGPLVPHELSTPAERLNYVRQARQGLAALMQAYDREETDLAHGHEGSNLSKSRSETEFDKIDREEASPGRIPLQTRTSSGWMPWKWSGPPTVDAAAAAKKDMDEPPAYDIPAEAKSSGADVGNH